MIDSWYTCRQIWRAALGRGRAITGGLKANRQMRIGQGQERRYVLVVEYGAGLTMGDYRMGVDLSGGAILARPSHLLVRTWVRKLGPCQLLVVRERLDQPLAEVRYWVTSELEAAVATVVG